MKKDIKRKVLNRLNRIEGQIRGIKKMVEKDTYCIDVITQSSAARKALSSVEDLMLENHLSTHVIHQIHEHQEKKAVREVTAVFRKIKNK